jgi:hypothetical protein
MTESLPELTGWQKFYLKHENLCPMSGDKYPLLSFANPLTRPRYRILPDYEERLAAHNKLRLSYIMEHCANG